MPDLLTTKLHVPAGRTRLVPRERLINVLLAGLNRRLTAISAAAGSGKTTLVTEFARRAERPVAWISLDSGDNDPMQFLAYLIAALSRVDPRIGRSLGALLQSSHPPTLSSCIVALANDIAAAHAEPLIVFDDYHTITSDEIHKAVSQLVTSLPPGPHTVLASRTNLPFSVALLRGRDELTEVRMSDLRFTLVEATEFLRDVMQLDLTAETIAELEARTEGWITGLQLAALSLQRRVDGAEFLKAFSGRHNYVLDYLVDEVIAQQPPAVQTFLLQTAILNRLAGPLCDAVTGQTGGEQILSDLENRNLFLIALDDERRWYRYHHLFSEFLLDRLREKVDASGVANLHRRASLWFQECGLVSESLEHAFAAGDYDTAARLIEANADQLYAKGAIPTLQRWLDRLPDEVFDARPRAAIYRGWVLFFAGEGSQNKETIFEQADSYLRRAERLSQDHSSEDSREQLGMIYAVRTAMASAMPARKSPVCAQRDLAMTIQCGQRALEYLPKENLGWRCVVNVSLGYAYQIVGDIAAAIRCFSDAAKLGHAGGNLSGALFAFSNWATLLVMQGKLAETERVYTEALRAGKEGEADSHHLTGQIYVGLGRLFYERNQLDEAASFLSQAISQAEAAGARVPQVLISLARVKWAQGDQPGARALAEQANEQLEQPMHQLFAIRARLEHLRLLLADGNVEAATNWLRTSAPSSDEEPTSWREAEFVALARVLIALKQPAKALEVLDKLWKSASASKRTGSLIEIATVQAAAHHAAGNPDAAQENLGRALEMGEPETYTRVFVDEGDRIHEVLGQLYQTLKKRDISLGFSRDYVERLLLVVKATAPERSTAQGVTLVEEFSERELEVMRLIAAGLSNQEIADKLFVAVTTIKWHVTNIFGKLGVRTRTQAVAKAKHLNLF
ncbi:MAG TPA: LuxR C-terminal-related transcriptional regulator [Blastocatellia bacterium]|nr:LuxR C-terminal-related transcriptional regulator [Blastocatellia bacterium]